MPTSFASGLTFLILSVMECLFFHPSCDSYLSLSLTAVSKATLSECCFKVASMTEYFSVLIHLTGRSSVVWNSHSVWLDLYCYKVIGRLLFCNKASPSFPIAYLFGWFPLSFAQAKLHTCERNSLAMSDQTTKHIIASPIHDTAE